MTLEWMAWTVPTAAFFAIIAAILVGMLIWQVRSPSFPRRGFLPMATTRGDRLFISLLTAAFLVVGWIAVSTAPLWYPLGGALVIGVAIMRYA